MSDRIAVDTNAVVDFLRASRPAPTPLLRAQQVFLPLPVLGELYAGAFASERTEENINVIEQLRKVWQLLAPDADTARIYGGIRAAEQTRRRSSSLDPARKNDLWVAALCLQHNLPLLTNDRGFAEVDRLHVLQW